MSNSTCPAATTSLSFIHLCGSAVGVVRDATPRRLSPHANRIVTQHLPRAPPTHPAQNSRNHLRWPDSNRRRICETAHVAGSDKHPVFCDPASKSFGLGFNSSALFIFISVPLVAELHREAVCSRKGICLALRVSTLTPQPGHHIFELCQLGFPFSQQAPGGLRTHSIVRPMTAK